MANWPIFIIPKTNGIGKTWWYLHFDENKNREESQDIYKWPVSIHGTGKQSNFIPDSAMFNVIWRFFRVIKSQLSSKNEFMLNIWERTQYDENRRRKKNCHWIELNSVNKKKKIWRNIQVINQLLCWRLKE